MTSWPKISIVIPTLNEEKNIRRCLDSVFNQDYPPDKLEVLVVDDDSTDQTVKIIKNYAVQIMRNGSKHGEIGKMVGFKAAQGEYFMYLDADTELISKDFFRQLVTPLVNNKQIIASFTKESTGADSSPIERYLSFDSLQRDGLFQFFTPSVESTIIKSYPGYFLCKYETEKIPPSGRCLYRRKELFSLVKNLDMFLELDFLKLLVINYHKLFSFVPQAVLYHHHVTTLRELLRKRKYNLTRVYFSHVQNNLYTWVDLSNPKDLFKIVGWIIFANSIMPSFILGIYKSIKNKDWAGMYEPIVNLLVTDMLIIEFIKNPKGRNMLSNIHNE